jgi:hypothetical protein
MLDAPEGNIARNDPSNKYNFEELHVEEDLR